MKFLISVWGLSRLSVDSLNLLVWVEDPALPSFWPATIRTVWLMDGSAGGGGLPGTRAGPKHRLSRPDSSAGPWGTVHWSRILPCDCLLYLHFRHTATASTGFSFAFFCWNTHETRTMKEEGWSQNWWGLSDGALMKVVNGMCLWLVSAPTSMWALKIDSIVK